MTTSTLESAPRALMARCTPSTVCSYSDLLADYDRCDRTGDTKWWTAQDCTLEGAIRRAAESTLENRHRHDHQRRIPARVLTDAGERLAADAEKVRACSTFHDLWLLVRENLRTLKGVGELVTYDIADRIAYHLGLAPDRIYLHNGTRIGALEYLPDLDRQLEWVELSTLGPEFQHRSARDLEDIFCIYQGQFAPLRRHLATGK